MTNVIAPDDGREEVSMWTTTKRAALVTAALLAVFAGSANAQPFRVRFGVGRGYVYTPFVYDPFWGPYPYPLGGYPYAAYPYVAYPFGAGADADVRVEVTPKQTEVY